MSEQLKLTLTSQALERLLGGDEAVAVELRQGIANEFAKRHLKGVIGEEVAAIIGKFRTEIAAAVSETVRDEMGESRPMWCRPTFNMLTDNDRTRIAAIAREHLAIEIRDEVNTALKGMNVEALVTAKANAKMDSLVEDTLRHALRAKIKEIADKL